MTLPVCPNCRNPSEGLAGSRPCETCGYRSAALLSATVERLTTALRRACEEMDFVVEPRQEAG